MVSKRTTDAKMKIPADAITSVQLTWPVNLRRLAIVRIDCTKRHTAIPEKRRVLKPRLPQDGIGQYDAP